MDDSQFNILIKALAEVLKGSNIQTVAVFPLEPFWEEQETWEIFVEMLEIFFQMENYAGSGEEIDNKKKEWLIHSMRAETLQLLYNPTSPDEPKTKSHKELFD